MFLHSVGTYKIGKSHLKDLKEIMMENEYFKSFIYLPIMTFFSRSMICNNCNIYSVFLIRIGTVIFSSCVASYSQMNSAEEPHYDTLRYNEIPLYKDVIDMVPVLF